MTGQPHVLVAGGGIGGVAAALGLATKGCQVTVLEQDPEIGEIGAGIQIGPNAFHALDYLGVGEAARTRAVYIDRLLMMDGISGDQIAEVPVDKPFRDRFGNPYAVIHRVDLHGTLLEACLAHDEIGLVTSQRVMAYENTGSGVRLTTEAGRDFAGDALIGCDGVYSKVREQITGGDDLRLPGHVAFRAVLPAAEMPEALRWNAATLWAGPRWHLVHYPLQGGRSYNVVAVFHTTTDRIGVNEPGRREEVIEHFRDIHPTPNQLLERPKEWRRWVLGDREPIENWSDDRVTLLGDAAHPTLQYFAQGACMAMEDAVCLSDRVEKSGGDFAAAFQAYQATRIRRAYRVVLSSRMLGHVYHAKGVERLIRNDIFGAKSPEDFYNGLAWLYGGNGLE